MSLHIPRQKKYTCLLRMESKRFWRTKGKNLMNGGSRECINHRNKGVFCYCLGFCLKLPFYLQTKVLSPLYGGRHPHFPLQSFRLMAQMVPMDLLWPSAQPMHFRKQSTLRWQASDINFAWVQVTISTISFHLPRSWPHAKEKLFCSTFFIAIKYS